MIFGHLEDLPKGLERVAASDGVAFEVTDVIVCCEEDFDGAITSMGGTSARKRSQEEKEEGDELVRSYSR
jgi:hypothetical protein